MMGTGCAVLRWHVGVRPWGRRTRRRLRRRGVIVIWLHPHTPGETDSKCQGAPDPQENPSCRVHQRMHRLTGRESPARAGDPQGTCQALLLDEVLAQPTAC